MSAEAQVFMCFWETIWKEHAIWNSQNKRFSGHSLRTGMYRGHSSPLSQSPYLPMELGISLNYMKLLLDHFWPTKMANSLHCCYENQWKKKKKPEQPDKEHRVWCHQFPLLFGNDPSEPSRCGLYIAESKRASCDEECDCIYWSVTTDQKFLHIAPSVNPYSMQ